MFRFRIAVGMVIEFSSVGSSRIGLLRLRLRVSSQSETALSTFVLPVGFGVRCGDLNKWVSLRLRGRDRGQVLHNELVGPYPLLYWSRLRLARSWKSVSPTNITTHLPMQHNRDIILEPFAYR